MLMDRAALTGIILYQRFLSPHKGFRCAHAALFGGPSCSAAVRDIIERHGLRDGKALIRARFADCRVAHDRLRAAPVSADLRAQGVCCCGGIPIPFRCG